MFAFVVSTSLWVTTVDADSRGTFDAVVEDLDWVIGNLAHFNSQSQAAASEPNRGTETQPPGHNNRDPGKRRVKPSLKVRENN